MNRRTFIARLAKAAGIIASGASIASLARTRRSDINPAWINAPYELEFAWSPQSLDALRKYKLDEQSFWDDFGQHVYPLDYPQCLQPLPRTINGFRFDIDPNPLRCTLNDQGQFSIINP